MEIRADKKQMATTVLARLEERAEEMGVDAKALWGWDRHSYLVDMRVIVGSELVRRAKLTPMEASRIIPKHRTTIVYYMQQHEDRMAYDSSYRELYRKFMAKKITVMYVETIEVAGLASALTALRLPFGKEVRSVINLNDNHFMATDNLTQEKTHFLTKGGSINVDNKDLALIQALIKRGDEHAKVMRGVVAWAKITAPVYWWCELETYIAGHQRLASESTMHIDCRGLVGEALQEAKGAISMGKILTKVDFFSYQCLRNIVRQRHDHRLPEWHQFIDWIHTLPLAEELIFVGLEAL